MTSWLSYSFLVLSLTAPVPLSVTVLLLISNCPRLLGPRRPQEVPSKMQECEGQPSPDPGLPACQAPPPVCHPTRTPALRGPGPCLSRVLMPQCLVGFTNICRMDEWTHCHSAVASEGTGGYFPSISALSDSVPPLLRKEMGHQKLIFSQQGRFKGHTACFVPSVTDIPGEDKISQSVNRTC